MCNIYEIKKMRLTKVLGFTTNSRNSSVSQPGSGNIIYIAGCIIVIYNPDTKTQQYLITDSKENITTLAISEDGQFLATADCGAGSTNKLVTVRIWNISSIRGNANQLSSSKLESSFNSNNIEISCMSFSMNNQVLVTFGSQNDPALSIWDWRRGIKMASQKLTNIRIRSISFAQDNSYFVTVGEAYVRYWYIKLLSASDEIQQESMSSPSTAKTSANNNQRSQEVNFINEASSISISSRAATLGEQKLASFCDVKCGRGQMASSTYCITKQGLLCELNSKRLLHKWVDLRTSSANCLAVSDSLIVIGCANGVARCFNTLELRFLKNLPRPHSLGTDIANRRETNLSGGGLTFPSLISLTLDESTNTISCIYNDRSIYIWDLTYDNSVLVKKKYSALYHSSCIWGIDVYPTKTPKGAYLLPKGSFITCSSDDTLRIWNPNMELDDNNSLQQQDNGRLFTSPRDRQIGSTSVCHYQKENVYKENIFSNESIKIIYTDPNNKFLCDLDCLDPDKSLLSNGGKNSNYDSNEGLRCLRLSPDGKHLAVGSRSGLIRVYDFSNDTELKSIAAHDAEVLCLEYSDPDKFNGYYYLASSSRDKLIHLFDAAKDYTFLQTIDDHSSSITALRFINNRTNDCLQLISCGTDQKIVFRNGTRANGNNDDRLEFITDRLIEGKTTFYDMEIDNESSCLMTACQDRIIRLFDIAQVKYQSGFTNNRSTNLDDGTIIKLALDPSCTFLAASCTDKTISIYDYQRGEIVASITDGLSDLITDMKFSPDGRHLVGCSGNGCIFIWTSPTEVANASGCLVNDHEFVRSPLDCQVFQNNIDIIKPNSVTDCGAQLKSSLLPEWARQKETHEEAPVSQLRRSISIDRSEQSYHVHRAGRMTAHTSTNSSDLCGRSDDDHDTIKVTSASGGSTNDYVRDYSCIGPNDDGDEDDDDDNDDDNTNDKQTQRYARSHRSTTSVRRLNRDHAGLVSNMAKYFQSRENLDKISSRQRYINDSLFQKDGTSRSSAVAGRSSISGQFIDKHNGSEEINGPIAAERHMSATMSRATDRIPNVRASRARSLSRGSHLADNQNSFSSSGDESSSIGDESRAAATRDRPPSALSSNNKSLPKQSSLYRQNRRILSGATLTRQQQQSFNNNNQYGTMGSSSSRTRTTSRRRAYNPLNDTVPNVIIPGESFSSATMRSSRSECNLNHYPMDYTDDMNDDDYDDLELGDLDTFTLEDSIYCEKLDFAKLDPARVHVDRGLCLHVVEELQQLSRFIAGLHQRLQRSSGCRNMASFISRGVQNSIGILSIIPSRSLDQQFQSQLNLSGTSSTLQPLRRGRPQVGLTNQRRPLISSSNLNASSINDLSSSATGGVILNNGYKLSRAPSQVSSRVVESIDSTMSGNKNNFDIGSIANGGSHHEDSVGSSTRVSSDSHQSRRNDKAQGSMLNIDQVLEAYSDRLFKMVQQRMDHGLAGSSAPTEDSPKNAIVFNQQQTDG